MELDQTQPQAEAPQSQPVSTNNAVIQKSDGRQVEKSLMVLLFVITVTQFSAWGYQAVVYILGLLFAVETISSPLDVIIGFAAMIASAFVFAGAALWWRLHNDAKSYLQIGSMLFIGKNILDLFNEIVLFSKTEVVTNQEQIKELAAILADQFFQLAFWVFVIIYVKYKLQAK